MRLLATALTLTLVVAFAGGARASVGDTLLPADIAYAGYRLHVRNVEVTDQKGDRFELTFEAVNTGRRPIAFGPGFPAHYLQTVFDGTLAGGGLLPLAPGLREAICSSALEVGVGEWRKGLTHWVSVADGASAEHTFKIDAFERTTPRVRRPAPTKRKSAAVAPPPTTAPTPTPAIAEPRAPCADLRIAELKLLVKAKGKATLQLYLENSGATSIAYADLPAGLGIDFYLGGAPQITGSSRRVGRAVVDAKLKALKDAVLAPGAKAVLVERVDIESATRYTGVITAQLDPGQQLRECDETNNEASVLLYE